MCGIAGIVWADQDRPPAREAIAVVAATIAHRGPDDAGFYFDGPVALAHRRLSIIDLSAGGHQPMVTPASDLAIVFNGEIYNFIELRDELRACGYVFRTEGDTEVILHAYRHWGRSCVERFNGMWAFALYDRMRREIFLSRDRFGIKPLYYTLDEERFAFASEIKGLLAGFPDLRQPRASMIHHFMPSGALDDGVETFFQRVVALAPAHNLVVSLDRFEARIERHWKLDREAFSERWGRGDPTETLRGLLDSSIALHMRSDVPVGTCLSGGVDSSALVCLMSRARSDPVHTFSGLYPDAEYDESRWVQAIRRHTGCHGTDIRPQPQGDLLDDLRKITWHQDEPSAGPGLYTQYHVMRRASEDVKVILDGQGADELFGGYLPYLALRVNDLLEGGASERIRGLGLLGATAYHTDSSILGGVHALRTLTRLRSGLARRMRSHAGLTEEPPFFHPGLAERAAGTALMRERPTQYPDSLSDALYWHLVQQSIPALLHYEDRNSMAFSIEARVPYLDHRIVEFALCLDPSWKIRNTWTKWVLRRAVSDVVPSEVTWRRSKLGYPTPFARWLRQPAERDSIADVLFSPAFLGREVMTRESLQYYWNQHQSGAADRSWLLYRCLTLELWYRMFIDNLDPAPARRVETLSTASAMELAQ
jgi:asparagine synthase (glutamine-hydrolysing)